MTTSSAGTRKNAKGRPKHVPQRMCVVCRETNSKRTLTRVVRTSEATFEIDPTGRANGRGAYLCDTPSCWEKAAVTPILARALRVSPNNESIELLKEFAAGMHLNSGAMTPTVGSREKHE